MHISVIIGISRVTFYSELEINLWTSSRDYRANHYAIQIQVPEQLKTSLLKCLCENPPLHLGKLLYFIIIALIAMDLKIKT